MPEREAAGLAAQWLASGEEDLAVARGAMTRRSLFVARHACFQAQQAAEKAIKALCIAAQMEVVRIHDLSRLVDLLEPASRPSVPDADVAWLSGWATDTRYPGAIEANWSDAGRAVGSAEAVVADARARLGGS